MDAVSKQKARRLIIDTGISPVLVPAGFSATKTAKWSRATGELHHVVDLGWRYRYTMEFGLTCPPVAQILYGVLPEATDLRHAIAYGDAWKIHWPAANNGFKLGDMVEQEEIESIVATLRVDAETIASWTAQFDSRSDLRRHLLRTREEKDQGNGFVFPVSLGARLLVAAALAVVDVDPATPDLIREADEAWFGKYPDERMQRLKEAAAVHFS